VETKQGEVSLIYKTKRKPFIREIRPPATIVMHDKWRHCATPGFYRLSSLVHCTQGAYVLHIVLANGTMNRGQSVRLSQENRRHG